MSEEVGKALQSVVERVNQAAARRPKVNRSPGGSAQERRCRRSTLGVLRQHDSLCKVAKYLNLWMGDSRACGSTFITPCMVN